MGTGQEWGESHYREDEQGDEPGEVSPEDIDLDFELESDEIGHGRTSVIHDAADELDDLGVILGKGSDTRRAAAAELALELDQDEAKLSRPELLKLDTSKLTNDAPVRDGELLKRWRFYWLSFPLWLVTGAGRGFNRLEFKVTFNADDAEEYRPRMHDALPTQQFAQLAEASGTLRVGIGGHLKCQVSTPSIDLTAAGLPLAIGAGAYAGAEANTGLVLGPFDYALRVPRVRRSGPDLDKVLWRLEGRSMVDERDPGLRVVLKVPVGVDHLQVRAVMRARRYVNSLDGTFVDAMESMGQKVKYFFSRGAPIGDTQTWDLSGEL